MSVLILGVAFVLARGRAWYGYRPDLLKRGTGEDLTRDPLFLMVGFVLLIGVSMAVTLIAAGGGSVTTFLAVAGALVVGFLLSGIYTTARSNGHPHAYAVGEAVITLGVLVLVAIVGWLLMTAGA
jgi:FtsH-binding integral membrane protein